MVFPHSNPTWSYLWRNVIAPLAREFRCLAPDLPGMGRSAPSDGRYRFLDHACHLDACFTTVLPEGPLALVAHDWDVALRLGWAGRYPERLRAFAHVEGVVRGRRRADSPGGDAVFRTVRSEQGEATVRGEDMFVERMLSMGPCGIWIRARTMPTESRSPRRCPGFPPSSSCGSCPSTAIAATSPYWTRTPGGRPRLTRPSS
ncbi:hypothetical protein GCM10018784_78410 [Streptomyces hydrogenans]|nr:hypothetical protein GCM10018784_78410 [Streptomyces hydrogenans]